MTFMYDHVVMYMYMRNYHFKGLILYPVANFFLLVLLFAISQMVFFYHFS